MHANHAFVTSFAKQAWNETLTGEKTLLTPSEKKALYAFRQYLITPGQMLCFYGPDLEKHKSALQQLTEKDLLVKESFTGAYSLTHAGFEAMKTCGV